MQISGHFHQSHIAILIPCWLPRRHCRPWAVEFITFNAVANGCKAVTAFLFMCVNVELLFYIYASFIIPFRFY